VAVNYERLLNWTFQDEVQAYDERDTILYALGVGCGAEPEDLKFVYERGLCALPSMATVLSYPGFWLRNEAFGIDWTKVVHGEQLITQHAPLPLKGTAVSKSRVVDVVDKGPQSGLFVYCERLLYEAVTETLLATLEETLILRGDGRQRSPRQRTGRKITVPDRAPDAVINLPTLPQAALIYRLCGDLNPLHVDPEAAAKAGFPKPILHGLCTMGLATRAVLRACCHNDPARLRSIGARFNAPVFPGETIETQLWREDGGNITFRCGVSERKVVVLEGAALVVKT